MEFEGHVGRASSTKMGIKRKKRPVKTSCVKSLPGVKIDMGVYDTKKVDAARPPFTKIYSIIFSRCASLVINDAPCSAKNSSTFKKRSGYLYISANLYHKWASFCKTSGQGE